mgnify:CR=1 FL=1
MNEEQLVNEAVTEVEVDVFDKAITRLEKEIYVRTQNIKRARKGIMANKHASRFFAKPQYEKNGYAEHWIDGQGTALSMVFANKVMQLENLIAKTKIINERDEKLLFQMMENKDNELYREHLMPFILASGMATDFSEDELIAIENAKKVETNLQTEEEIQDEIDKLLEDEKVEEALKEQEEEHAQASIDEPKEN